LSREPCGDSVTVENRRVPVRPFRVTACYGGVFSAMHFLHTYSSGPANADFCFAAKRGGEALAKRPSLAVDRCGASRAISRDPPQRLRMTHPQHE